MVKRFFIFLFLVSLCCVSYAGESYIVISKKNLTLTVFGKNDNMLFRTGVSCGKNIGDKMKSGDMRTPEGCFRIQQIQNSSSWQHDFGDGKGAVKGAYGPYFIRLSVPGFSGIGIHGTCYPESISSRSSEGCVRLTNPDLNLLMPYVRVGMKVYIMPD